MCRNLISKRGIKLQKVGSALSVLKVAKKDLGKDQAGQERCCSKGVATVDSQKDGGIIAIKGKKEVSRTGEVALVGDLPWMLPGRCLEEVRRALAAACGALFVPCTGDTQNLSAFLPSCPLGAGPALSPLPLCPASAVTLQVSLHRCCEDRALCSAGRVGIYSSSHALRAALSLVQTVFAMSWVPVYPGTKESSKLLPMASAHLPGLGTACRPGLAEAGVKPQLPEDEEDAPDHIHIPALQGRLRLAVGYYSSVATGVNKRSHVHMNAGPGASGERAAPCPQPTQGTG